MHSKQKGSIGEIATVKYLLEEEFTVFGEFGDLSKIDLLAEKDNTVYRIQCKSLNSKNSLTVEVDSRKSGPGYAFKYNQKQIDIFAVYVLDLGILFFIPSKELCSQTSITFRFAPVKNGQTKGIKFAKDYTLERCLRDCTRCIPTEYSVDDDTVQTTTTMASES